MSQNHIIGKKNRLAHAEYMTFKQRCAIIRPRRHAFTDSHVDNVHRRFKYNLATVMDEIRQCYVIPDLRSKLKSIRSRCISCRRQRETVETVKMTALPISRLFLIPATYTGLDYFD